MTQREFEEVASVLKEGLVIVADPLTAEERARNWTPRAQDMMVEWFRQALAVLVADRRLLGDYVHLARWLDFEGISEGRRYDRCLEIQSRLSDLEEPDEHLPGR